MLAIRPVVELELRHRVTIDEKLDEALDESFPASDPVSLGHSDHIGRPKPFRKRGGKLPKGSAGLEGKR